MEVAIEYRLCVLMFSTNFVRRISHFRRIDGYMAKDVSRFSCKGKSVPLQTRSGPEGSRKLMFPDFVTTAQNGGKVVSLTHRLLLPLGNTPGAHFC